MPDSRLQAWLAMGAREPGAAGEQVAQLLRAYVIGCSWLTEVARMVEATGLRDGVDRKVKRCVWIHNPGAFRSR